MVQLTEEQKDAANSIVQAIRRDEQVMCLTGPAGVGKTTLMREVSRTIKEDLGLHVRHAAPTGKAAYVLSTKTGGEATTLHALLYGQVGEIAHYDKDVNWNMVEGHDLFPAVRRGFEADRRFVSADPSEEFFEAKEWVDTRLLKKRKEMPDVSHPFWSPTSDIKPRVEVTFGGPKNDIKAGDVVIVDEASMVTQTIHDEIMAQMPYGAFLLYVGDKEQLPPVKDTWGPDFDYPTAELSEIHRQAVDNPIIQVATSIREGGTFPLRNVGSAFTRQTSTSEQIARWAAERVQADADSIVLCFTRKVRAHINKLTRLELGFTEAIQVGDRLKVAKNNKLKGRVNGEVVTVESVERFEGNEREEVVITVVDAQGQPTVALAQPDLIGADQGEFNAYCKANRLYREERDKYLHFDYGYAITVHSAQGSEWDDTAFVFCSTCHWKRRDDPEFMRRLLYTASTRAISKLTVFDHRSQRGR